MNITEGLNSKYMIDTKLVKDALLLRKVEEKLFNLSLEGKIHGTIHACIGQEFSAIAFIPALINGDSIFSNHRCHGHFIIYTKNFKGLIAELMGKETGICAGIGSSQHLYSGNFFSNGIQGGMVPVAAGMALAKKLSNTHNIALVFIGDGTLGQGIVYETMNIASLWHIPVLIVCENNYYAQSTKQSINLSSDILKRAESFGLKTYKSNTWDIDNLLRNAKSSIDYTRNNSLPAFHLVDTYRLCPHSRNDDYRDQQEVDKYKDIDPLNVFARKYPDIYKEYSKEIDNKINEAVDELSNVPPLSLAEYYKPDYTDEKVSEFEDIKEIDIRQAELINSFFKERMGNNKSIIFMGEDVLSPYGGAFKIAQGLSEKYPDQVFSTPISESSITGIANGLALGGYRPFLEIMFGDFLTLCMDQIINHASKFHHMYNKQVNCPIVIRTPMGGRRGYGPTHSQTLDKYLVGIDNVTTVALNTLIDPGVIYKTILEKENHPVIVIENKTDYAKKIAKKRIKNYRFEKTISDYPVVRIRPIASIPNATIVTYGGMVDITLDAIQPLFLELDLKCEIIVLTKIHPIDYKEIIESLRQTKKLYVIEEGSFFAGLGSEIISSVVEMLNEKIIAKRITALPVPIPAAKSLENLVLPSVETIIEKIRESLK